MERMHIHELHCSRCVQGRVKRKIHGVKTRGGRNHGSDKIYGRKSAGSSTNHVRANPLFCGKEAKTLPSKLCAVYFVERLKRFVLSIALPQ